MNATIRTCSDKEDIQYTVFSFITQKRLYGVDLLILNFEMAQMLIAYFEKRHLTWKYFYEDSRSSVAFTIHTEWNSIKDNAENQIVIITFEELSKDQFNIMVNWEGVEVLTILTPVIKNDSQKLSSDRSIANRNDNKKEYKSSLRDNNSIIVSLEFAKDHRDDYYSEIWKGILEWTENECEISLLENLIRSTSNAKDIEKPYENVEIIKDNVQYVCDLYWKKAQVMYFSTCNYDDYLALKDNYIKCIYGGDDSYTASDIIALIRGV